MRSDGDDPIAATALLLGDSAASAGTRIVRAATLTADDTIAARNGATVVHWPVRELSAAPTLQGLTVQRTTWVAALGRDTAALAPRVGEPIGWWADGSPAVWRERLGRGCMLQVRAALPVAGDQTLSLSAQAWLAALLTSCDAPSSHRASGTGVADRRAIRAHRFDGHRDPPIDARAVARRGRAAAGRTGAAAPPAEDGMTPLQLLARLDRVRASLRALMLGSIATWALSAGSLALAICAVLRLAAGGPSMMVAWLVAAITSASVAWWRVRREQPSQVGTLDAALWVEAQAPDLRYSLVTLAEQPRVSDTDPLHARLATFTASTRWQDAVDAALRQRRTQLAGRAAAAVVAFALAAYPWSTRRAAAGTADRPVTAIAAPASAPGRVQASVHLLPPVYTGRGERALEFGQTVTAITGSVIRIDAAGARDRATLVVQESSDSGASAAKPVNTAPRADGWRGDVRIGSVPLALRLRDAVGERWLLVTPVADSAPIATMLQPDADTVVIDTTAKIRVAGTVHDDIGLRDARVEYIVSSGGGRAVHLPQRRAGRAEGGAGTRRDAGCDTRPGRPGDQAGGHAPRPHHRA